MSTLNCQTATSRLEASIGRSYHFPKFLKAAKTYQAAIADIKIDPDPISRMLRDLETLGSSGWVLGRAGAIGWIKFLQRWSLFPLHGEDSHTAFDRYRKMVQEKKHPFQKRTQVNPRERVSLKAAQHARLLQNGPSIPEYTNFVHIGIKNQLVFRANPQNNPSETVIIKIFPINWVEDASRLVFFSNNLHPQLLNCRTSAEFVMASAFGFTIQGDPYIVMREAAGQGLNKVNLMSASNVPAAKSAVASVARLHAQGLSHYDIKPSNFMKDTSDRVCLLDFDNIGPATERPITRILGTAGYTPPEEYALYTYGPRRDVFSLAVTLYEKLTGHHPYESAAVFGALFLEGTAIRNEVIESFQVSVLSPSQVNPSLPTSLDRPILKGLSRDPLQRQKNAGELLRDLETAA